MTEKQSAVKLSALQSACEQYLSDLDGLSSDDNSRAIISQLKKDMHLVKQRLEKMTHSRSSEACQLAEIQLNYLNELNKAISEQCDNDEYRQLASEYVIDASIYTMKLALYLNFQKKEDEKDDS